MSTSATGVQTKDITGLKEIIHFVYTLTGTNNDGRVHLIAAEPAWRPF